MCLTSGGAVSHTHTVVTCPLPSLLISLIFTLGYACNTHAVVCLCNILNELLKHISVTDRPQMFKVAAIFSLSHSDNIITLQCLN